MSKPLVPLLGPLPADFLRVAWWFQRAGLRIGPFGL
jgi:hypothetical protein